MSLRDYLPNFIAEEKYTKEILDAIEPEIDRLKTRLSEILLECCVTTCTELGMARFERDYSIVYNPNISLSERKKRVLNKMMSKRKLTKSELIRFIKRNIDNTSFSVTNMAEKYEFQVVLAHMNYATKLYDALFKARPAHLVFNVVLVKHEKYCGTFNCNESIL